jgi:hypothetical protein
MAALVISSQLLICFHLFTAAALIIGGTAAAFHLSKSQGSWTIHGGAPSTAGTNSGFLTNIVLVLLAIAEFAFAIVEILLCFPSCTRIHTIRIGFMRPIIYVALGILSLGAAASLGIAAGSLIFAAAAIWLFLAILAVVH